MQLPNQFVEALERVLPEGTLAEFVNSLSGPLQQCVIRNRTKPHPKPAERIFTSWTRDLEVTARTDEHLDDPLFHSGAYCVGEVSQTFLLEVLKQKLPKRHNLMILDLSCNGGFNAMMLSNYFDDSCLILCNEEDEQNYTETVHRVGLWGRENIWVSNHNIHELKALQGIFDLVIVNPPSSNEGLLRREPSILNDYNEELIEACVMLQKYYLQNAVPLLKEHGLLVYCNNAYNKKETSEVVEWIFEQHDLESLPFMMRDGWNLHEEQDQELFSYRLFPHTSGGEGFFVSCFMSLDYFPSHPEKIQNKWQGLKMNQFEAISPWIDDAWRCFFFTNRERKFFVTTHQIPKGHRKILGALERLSPGIYIGTHTPDTFVPSHYLGVHSLLTGAMAKIEVVKGVAQLYKMQHEFPLPENIQVSPGWVTLSYQGLRIGWIKIDQNLNINYSPVNRR